MKIKWNSWLAKKFLAKRFDFFTFRNTAYCRYSRAGLTHKYGLDRYDELIRHEAVHIKQYKRYGTVGFLIRYLRQWKKYGYDKMPLEKEAVEAESG